jgi:Spy/CpxP family protein refolding chaperone
MKLNILFGILIFLVVVNIAAVDTYLYFHLSDRQAPATTGSVLNPAGQGGDPLARLDDSQRQKLRDMMESFKRSTGELHGRIRVLDDEILASIQSDTIPRNKIDQDLTEISSLRLDISKKALDEIIEAKAFLSKDQQERLFSGIFRTTAGPAPEKGEPRSSMDDRNREGRDIAPGHSSLPPPPDKRLKKYAETLNLTPNQAAQVKTILEASWKKFLSIGTGTADSGDNRAAVKAARDDEDSRIEKLLTPGQKIKFESMKKQHEKRPPPDNNDEPVP